MATTIKEMIENFKKRIEENPEIQKRIAELKAKVDAEQAEKAEKEAEVKKLFERFKSESKTEQSE